LLHRLDGGAVDGVGHAGVVGVDDDVTLGGVARWGCGGIGGVGFGSHRGEDQEG
jgi:hypothetical protein